MMTRRQRGSSGAVRATTQFRHGYAMSFQPGALERAAFFNKEGGDHSPDLSGCWPPQRAPSVCSFLWVVDNKRFDADPRSPLSTLSQMGDLSVGFGRGAGIKTRSSGNERSLREHVVSVL
jgi:hypothetical protein